MTICRYIHLIFSLTLDSGYNNFMEEVMCIPLYSFDVVPMLKSLTLRLIYDFVKLIIN